MKELFARTIEPQSNGGDIGARAHGGVGGIEAEVRSAGCLERAHKVESAAVKAKCFLKRGSAEHSFFTVGICSARDAFECGNNNSTKPSNT